jgi:hypothetical protein
LVDQGNQAINLINLINRSKNGRISAMNSEITVRPIIESDLEDIRALFYRCYGENYPYTEFYSDEWLKRSIYGDSYLSLLAEVDGQVVGTASVNV